MANNFSSQLTNVFVHKVEPIQSITPESISLKARSIEKEGSFVYKGKNKFMNSDLKLDDEDRNHNLVEINNIESLIPYADAKPDIQFHNSPRNMDELQFIDKLNQSYDK